MSFVVTSSADRTQSLPASRSTSSAVALDTAAQLRRSSPRLHRIHPSSHQEGGVDAIGRLYPLKPPCVSLRSAAVAWYALSCGYVALRNPLDPRRRVMEHRGAFAGCIALREPLVVSHIPGRT